MRVVNWYKWTRFKKRVVGVGFCTGFILSFGLESNLMFGVAGICVLGVSALVMNTIADHEW